jgi:hypothetical protein
VARAFDMAGGVLVPEASAAWLYDFGIDDRVIRAAFAGAPDQAFTIQGRDVESMGFRSASGWANLHSRGFSVAVKYRGDFRQGEGLSAVLGELGYRF